MKTYKDIAIIHANIINNICIQPDKQVYRFKTIYLPTFQHIRYILFDTFQKQSLKKSIQYLKSNPLCLKILVLPRLGIDRILALPETSRTELFGHSLPETSAETEPTLNKI